MLVNPIQLYIKRTIQHDQIVLVLRMQGWTDISKIR